MTVRVVAGDDHPRHAFEQQQRGHVGHRHLALGVLAAGHRHRAVVEQLVGDVDAGGDRGAHGQRPGVEERAVAEVLHEWFRPTNGAMPIHWAPSDPMQVSPTRSPTRSDPSSPPWRDSRSRRRRACRFGARAAVVGASGAVERGPVHVSGMRVRFGSTSSWSGRRRSASRAERRAWSGAIRASTSRVPWPGTSNWPCSSRRPTTRGWCGPP
jgi:hypothetical protein